MRSSHASRWVNRHGNWWRRGFPPRCSISPGPQRGRLCRGSKRLSGIPLGKNQYDRLPALADDLVHRQVQVIAATSTPAVWKAAKAATARIPIVFQGGGDPVKLGFVASLRQPGGNATGVVNMSAELTAKRLEILRELVPTATQIAILSHPEQPTAEPQVRELAAAARNMHQETFVVNASNEHEIDEAFAILVQRNAGALFVISDSLFTNRRQQLVALAARYAIPAMYAFRVFPATGGLISYGADLADEWRKTGVYVGRILKGEKPANLPIQEPTKFELVINLKTAKALGLNVSRDFLLRCGKLLTHTSGRVADCLDRACKLLLCCAQMPRPNPDRIFTVDDDLAAVAGYACVSFHGLFLLPRGRINPGFCVLCRFGMLIDAAFGDFRQSLIRLFFLGQGILQQLTGFIQSQFLRPGPQRPVARDFVMLDRLCRREQAGIQSWASLVFLHYFLPFLDDANDGIASLAARRFVQLGKHFVEAFDMVLGFILVGPGRLRDHFRATRRVSYRTLEQAVAQLFRCAAHLPKKQRNADIVRTLPTKCTGREE
jgi:putative tryptophan/tyrosine transport system substrate-binding protein